MEIKELRKLNNENHSKTIYIRYLQSIGELTRIINEEGYLCYDEDEYNARARKVKWGRPIKGVDRAQPKEVRNVYLKDYLKGGENKQ